MHYLTSLCEPSTVSEVVKAPFRPKGTSEMQLRPGARLASTVDATEIIVIRASVSDLDLRCGGHPMAVVGASPATEASIEPTHRAGTKLGKRYEHVDHGLEVLCTRGGEGSLSIGDEPLRVKQAKNLPASD